MNFLEVCGMVFIMAFIGFGGILIIEGIKDFVYERKRQYKIKHRFDKPPIAKCYCIDCINRRDDGSCSLHLKIARDIDDWFCKEATPIRGDLIDLDKESETNK